MNELCFIFRMLSGFTVNTNILEKCMIERRNYNVSQKKYLYFIEYNNLSRTDKKSDRVYKHKECLENFDKVLANTR